MRTVIVMLLFGVWFGLFAQNPTVNTRPEAQGWERVFNGTVGANGDGLDTTAAWSARNVTGALTFLFITDTTDASVAGANQSDSCLTVFIQLKRKYWTGTAYDEDWVGFYSGTDVTKTRLDSVARSIVNVGGAGFYMEPAEFDGWAWADSMRAILSIGVGDSLGVIMDVGGI